MRISDWSSDVCSSDLDEPSIVAPCCPRCDAPLHHRKRDSVRRSWAFLIAAAVLYIPANVLPIMNTSSLPYNQQNTILGGIRVLWLEGRSEERRVGQKFSSTYRFRWSP